MIVECPKCKSTYNLPDDKVESGDMKVRCTECKEVFTPEAAKAPESGEAETEAPEAGEAESEASDDIDDLVDDVLGEDAAEPEEGDAEAGEDEAVAESGDEAVAEAEDETPVEDTPDEGAGKEDAAEPKGDAEAGEDEAPAESEGGGSVEDTGDKEFVPDKDEDEDEGEASSEGESLSFDVEGGAKKKRKLKIKISKKLAIILAAAVLVLVLGGGAAWYFLSSDTPATEPEAQTGEAAEAHEDVRGISLKNIRQYYVDNNKAGRIFVLEGLAVNDFETPKGFIKIQADLFDETGEVLRTQGFLCGNSLSLYQLQVLGKEEIQSALADEAGIASSNVEIGPGMDVPFMAVFFEPPESVREFMVKVVEAKGPPEE